MIAKWVVFFVVLLRRKALISPSTSPGRRRWPPHVRPLRPSAPAHQKPPRRPTAARLPACSAAVCTYGACLGLSGGIRVSETAWLGWWSPVLVSQVMQQHSVQFPRGRCLFWTLSTGEEGLAYPCNVHEQLLTFLVLRTREECTDKRFDRVTRVGILQRSAGPARNELLLKLLFPPCGLRERAP